MHRGLTTLVGSVVAVALVALALFYPIPKHWTTNWSFKVLDLGHVPVFLVLTLAIRRLAGPSIWIAAGIALTFALAGEWLQEQLGRSGNNEDFLRSIVGILSAIVLVLGLGGRRTSAKWLATAGALVLLAAWPVLDAAPFLGDVYDGYRDFPILSDFQTPWQTCRWRVYEARLDRARVGEDEWAGRLVILPTRPATGGTGPTTMELSAIPNDESEPIDPSQAALLPVQMDWTGYRSLVWDISFQGEPLDLTFVVADDRKIQSLPNRFEERHRFPAGRHVVRLPLDSIARGPQNDLLDLRRVESVLLSIAAPAAGGRTLWIHEVRLE